MRAEAARERAIEALGEHLKRIGLDATVVTFKQMPNLGWRLHLTWAERGRMKGAVRIADRNIDFVELAEWWHSTEDSSYSGYGCTYVVQAKVEGLEDKLRTEGKPVRKSFLSSQVVDFKWEGKELAQVLNSDGTLRNMLYPADKLALKNKGLAKLPEVEIRPYTKHQCVRIRQKDYYHSPEPESAFPTIETFEAYDRIAQHIRSIAVRATGAKNG